MKHQSRGARKKKLYKLILALNDIVHARYACGLFGRTVDSLSHEMYQPLFHSVVVCYSKPFVDDKSLGPLPGHWRKFENPEYQKTHDLLLRTRNRLIAHNDLKTVEVHILPPGCKVGDGQKKGIGVGYAVQSYMLPIDKFREIWHTIEDLRIRLMKAVDEEMLVLYGLSQLPVDVFPLNFDDGL